MLYHIVMHNYPEGTGISAMIRMRASRKSSITGCPFTRRMINLRERLTIRPGILMNENRIAFMRRNTQDPPKTRHFMIVLRFIANIMIHQQAAFSPKSPDGNFPPAKSPFITECASSDFPQRSRCQWINYSPSQPMLVTR